MKIREVAATPEFPMLDLPGHTLLYHGTNTNDFMVPDGPAWFTLTPEGAMKWINWAGVHPSRTAGSERVMVFQSYGNLPLLDTRSEAAWRHLCLILAGDPDVSMGVIASAVQQGGYQGWYGRNEIMLVNPISQIYPRGVHKF